MKTDDGLTESRACCCAEVCRKCTDCGTLWLEIRDITDPWATALDLQEKSSVQHEKEFVYAISRVRIEPPEWNPEFSPVCMRIYCKSEKAIRRVGGMTESIKVRLFKKASFMKEHFWSAVVDVEVLSKILRLEGVDYEITECCPYLVEQFVLNASAEKNQRLGSN